LRGAKAFALLGRGEGRTLVGAGADNGSPLVRLRPLVHGRGQPFRRHGPPRRSVGDRQV